MTRPALTPFAFGLALMLGATLSAPITGVASTTASSAGSTAAGSLSDSVNGSSKSSSAATNVADGDYRVTEVAVLAERPGLLRLHLRAQDAGQGAAWGDTPVPAAAAATDATAFTLDLPQQALGSRGVAVGDVVRVQNRAYGLAFARPGTSDAGAEGRQAAHETFFLALNDAWRGDLDSRVVKF